MDFFEYASIAQMFVNTDSLWIPFLVGGLCFAAVFVFQSVGLFIIAGHEGYKNRWMAFVPFLNTYYIGVCGQKNRVFKSVDTKIFSICAAILEALLFAGYVLYFVAWIKLVNSGCVYEVPNEESIYASFTKTYEIILGQDQTYLLWAKWCCEYLTNYILRIAELAFLVLQIFVFAAFFQTFAAKRYMLFTITSVLFPVSGILVFILRNNKGMNYRDFMRMEQERQYRMYQQYRQQNNFDSNPYNQNPYSRNPYDADYNSGNSENRNSQNGSQNHNSDDPFSEFGGNNNNGGGNDPFEN